MLVSVGHTSKVFVGHDSVWADDAAEGGEGCDEAGAAFR